MLSFNFKINRICNIIQKVKYTTYKNVRHILISITNSMFGDMRNVNIFVMGLVYYFISSLTGTNTVFYLMLMFFRHAFFANLQKCYLFHNFDNFRRLFTNSDFVIYGSYVCFNFRIDKPLDFYRNY